MALDPLQTDEKLDAPVRAEADTDTAMLWGCGAFTTLSFTVFFVSCWPYFVWLNVSTLNDLGRASLLGLLPATILSIVGARLRGLPASCGAVAGFTVVAVFLFMRIQQAFVAGMAKQAPMPEFGREWAYTLPAYVVIGSLILAFLFTRKDHDRKAVEDAVDSLTVR